MGAMKRRRKVTNGHLVQGRTDLLLLFWKGRGTTGTILGPWLNWLNHPMYQPLTPQPTPPPHPTHVDDLLQKFLYFFKW